MAICYLFIYNCAVPKVLIIGPTPIQGSFVASCVLHKHSLNKLNFKCFAVRLSEHPLVGRKARNDKFNIAIFIAKHEEEQTQSRSFRRRSIQASCKRKCRRQRRTSEQSNDFIASSVLLRPIIRHAETDRYGAFNVRGHKDLCQHLKETTGQRELRACGLFFNLSMLAGKDQVTEEMRNGHLWKHPRANT